MQCRQLYLSTLSIELSIVTKRLKTGKHRTLIVLTNSLCIGLDRSDQFVVGNNRSVNQNSQICKPFCLTSKQNHVHFYDRRCRTEFSSLRNKLLESLFRSNFRDSPMQGLFICCASNSVYSESALFKSLLFVGLIDCETPFVLPEKQNSSS